MTLVKGHSDFKVKCLNLGLYTQVSDSGPLGPLVFCFIDNSTLALYRVIHICDSLESAEQHAAEKRRRPVKMSHDGKSCQGLGCENGMV